MAATSRAARNDAGVSTAAITSWLTGTVATGRSAGSGVARSSP